MRNVNTWSDTTAGSEPALMIAGRGFTGHEHLPWFSLINMNGRLYDPLTGQFLSADNYVQAPGFTQSFNRYAYCLNNPLIYTDPSGEKTLLGKFFHWAKDQSNQPWARGFIAMPSLLSVAPGEILSIDATTSGSFVTNFIRGGFEGGIQGVENFVKINTQLFKTGSETSLGSRFTVESLNTGLGYLAATLTNSFYGVKDVQYITMVRQY